MAATNLTPIGDDAAGIVILVIFAMPSLMGTE